MKYNEDHLKNVAEMTIDYGSIVEPVLRPLLGDLHAKSVLDVGCGTGKYSRLAASLNASVTAIDKGQSQISAAKQTCMPYENSIDFIVGDIRGLKDVGSDFDLVFLMFLVLDISTEQELREIIRASVSVMKPGARIIVADVHPHNFNRQNDVEFVTPIRQGDYFTIGCPTSSKVLMKNGEMREFRPSYHFPLDFLIGLFCGAGLSLTNLIEPRFRTSFPTHIVMEFQRPIVAKQD